MTDAARYEVHLTIGAVPEPVDRPGLEYTRIVLRRGAVPTQPRYTGRGRGSADQRRLSAEAWRRALEEDGLDVIRTKIEVDARGGVGVPLTDGDAAAEPAGRYFEHHVKVRPGDGEEAVERLVALAAPHGAHVSYNTLPEHEGEWFVTQRCHAVGRETAQRRLDALVEALAGLEVLRIEAEWVEFDSAIEVDAGWLA